MTHYSIGIDTGGTYTDAVVIQRSDKSGSINIKKPELIYLPKWRIIRTQYMELQESSLWQRESYPNRNHSVKNERLHLKKWNAL